MIKPYYQEKDITIYHSDCLTAMRELKENSIDTIITDPPYGLGFMGKEWDTFRPDIIDKKMKKDSRNKVGISAQRRSNSAGSYDFSRNAEFQMAINPFFIEMLRVSKPGATLLCFGGTRTYHRLACAIEDAGWVLKDCIVWLYASGFPKATDIKKNLIKTGMCGSMEAYEKTTKQTTKYCLRLMPETNISQTVNPKDKQREVLQPSLSEQNLQIQQPKSTKNVWEKQSSVEGWHYLQASQRELQRCKVCALSERISKDGEKRWLCNGTPFSYGTAHWTATPKDRSCPSYRPRSEQQSDRQSDVIPHKQSPQEIRSTLELWNGWKSHGLKPAYEPILVAMKPNEGSYDDNVLKQVVAGLTIDGGRIKHN